MAHAILQIRMPLPCFMDGVFKFYLLLTVLLRENLYITSFTQRLQLSGFLYVQRIAQSSPWLILEHCHCLRK